MSRTVIAAVVAVVIAGLTAIAYFVTSQSFEERARKDADVALTRAYQVVHRLNQLQAIDVSNKAERLAALPEFVGAIKSSATIVAARATRFPEFIVRQGARSNPTHRARRDVGDMRACTRSDRRAPVEKRRSRPPSPLNVALRKRVSSGTSVLRLDGLKIGVAPSLDPDHATETPDASSSAARSSSRTLRPRRMPRPTRAFLGSSPTSTTSASWRRLPLGQDETRHGRRLTSCVERKSPKRRPTEDHDRRHRLLIAAGQDARKRRRAPPHPIIRRHRVRSDAPILRRRAATGRVLLLLHRLARDRDARVFSRTAA